MWESSLQEASNTRENGQDSVASGPAGNHTQYFKLCMTSLIIFIYLSFSPFASSKAVVTSRILVLNSYHKGLPWTDNIVSGIESVLVRENIGTDLVIEYMDSKAVKYDKTYKTMLYKLYSHKYSHQRFDVIISSDDNAFNFLHEYRKEIFPDTPIVFCGVNNLEAPTIISKDHFTGILEIAAQKETLDLAFKIHPETKQVVIVTDTTSSGQYSWKQLEPFFIQYPDITFTRIDDRFSISEIEDRMKKLSDDTIAIFTSLYRDKTGRYFSLSEGTSRISKASRRPIYSFHTQVLQHGTIGGKLLGGLHHGEKSAELAIRVLQGEKVSNIPIVDQSDAQYIFDYQQLERFGIKLSDLPKESIIINKPASIYEENKQGIWIVSGVLVCLITVVVLLALYIIRSRKVEQDRLESEEKLKLLFDHSPVGICTVDLLGNFVTTNPAYEQMLGYSKEELKERSFFEVTHPDYRPKNKALFQNMFSLKSTGFKIEKKYIRNDSDEIDVSVNAIAIMDDKGKARFGTAFVEDITEHKQAEEALRLNEAKYRHLYETMTQGVVIQDADGKIIEANMTACGILGLTMDQLLGKTAYDPRWKLIQEDGTSYDPNDMPSNIALRTGKPSKEDHCGVYVPEKDEYRWLIIGSAPRFKDGEAKPFSTMTVFTDITEHKKAEMKSEKLQEQLLQAQKMEAVGNLAGGVAHDYNNMLSVILGYTEFALESTELPSSVHDDLVEVLSAAKRSTEITRQLLAFARKQTIEPIVLDLNDTIEEMLKMIRRLIGEDIDLSWLPDGQLWSVNMDPSQLDQILVNLCVNARDAITDVGKVTIETGNIPIDEKYCSEHIGSIPGDFILLAISDDGCGMTRETIEKIFEPFFTTKILGQGTGMGLSTVFGIVKQNGGFINVYSELGVGTTFKIYLPRHEGEFEEAITKGGPTNLLARGETVLVVEDEDSILQLCKRMLTELGYSVLTANTPEIAINIAKKHDKEIHLLITDVIMPKMNGRILAEHLQLIYPALKIVFMSGYTANVIAHHGVLEKGIHFIPKPLSRQVLAAKVREVLEEKNL